MRVRIKFCGITRYEDARIAVNLGVDALGFIFYPKSPRYIKPEDARNIIKKLPPFVSTVGVFVDETAKNIATICKETSIDMMQLHGNEPPGFCGAMPRPVIKAFSVGPETNMALLKTYPVTAFLLDTWHPSVRGGTGQTFDWSIAKKAAAKYPIILAGGLGPTNLQEAIEQVGPYAVDVNSGIEIRPGIKHPHKMRDAIAIVRAFK